MATEEPRTSSVVRGPAEPVIAAVPEDPVVPVARAALAVPEDLVVPVARAALAVPEDLVVPAVRAALVVPENLVVPAVRVALVVPESPVVPVSRVVPEDPVVPVSRVVPEDPVVLELAPAEAELGLVRVAVAQRTRLGTAVHLRDLVRHLAAEVDLVVAAAETTREPAAIEAAAAWAAVE
jgi:hypothetical protein